ncbi:MFS transporter [Nocardiopsis sp. L17-MgMaSL7]|uniref:MFS transporter n=1 Tax=Nocardiopsis sp. L17-MgMaSL7 TaxID=1938893 RepID=UPI000D717E76|nr:MFS transporter [Nocardiopsis sp. L17-MgMaSL7]PWV54723.1 MFS transporter [Nocardiopsis sp. L17-MgMaSL7]
MPSPRIDGVGGHRDFRRLWAGAAVSQFGSAVGLVALPVIAVVVLDAAAWQVSLLAGITALTTVLVAFHVGRVVEHARKRPVMIGGDLLRAVTLASLPAAHALGALTYTHLCAVAAVNAVCAIAFTGASQAHLKSLVSPSGLIDANSRLESTRWLGISLGPALTGALIAALSAVGALAATTVGYLFGALAVRTIREPEPAPPVRPARGEGASRREELFAGLGFVWGHPTLRPILFGWVLFAGASSMAAPLTAVFYMRDLGFSAFEYGLLMGVPSLGGLLGARLVPRLVRRLGALRTLRWASLLRGPWYFLIPFAVPGPVGLLMCGTGFGLLLVFAAAANSAMAGYRQLETPDALMSRVATLWAFATTVSQPLFILVGGVVASLVDARAALLAAAVAMALAGFLLPRGGRAASPP